MDLKEGVPYFHSRSLLNMDFPFKIFRYSSQLLKQTLHMHDYVQIAYLNKGMCNHRMRGKSLTVSQGELFIITPGNVHSFSAIPGKEFELMVIDFAPDLLEGHLGQFRDRLKPYLDPAPSPAPHVWIHIGKTKQPFVAQLMQDMQDEYDNKEIGYEFSIRLSLVKLLIVAEREVRRHRRLPERSDAHADLQPIEEVCRYIHDNYSQDIPLELGAYIANMAPAYFSHRFKKATGQSFIDYVNEVRIDRAMELIRRRSLTITQVGFQVGYRNLGHFIRTFKKRTGITPSEYKRTFVGAIQPTKD